MVKVEARFFILTDDCFIDDFGIKKIKILSSKGQKKIKVEKEKDKDGNETGRDLYVDLPELTTVEAMQVLAAAEGEILVDVDPLIALFGTYGVIGKFTSNEINYTIIRAAIPRKVISDIKKALLVNDALSLETLEALGITYIYGGRNYSTEPDYGLHWVLQTRYGIDLSGEYEAGVDEYGVPIMMPHLLQLTIAGEEE